MADYLAPPYRIKMIESISLPTKEQRELALQQANYNLFNLKAGDIYLDFLTDSGTGAMSQNQWAAMMIGDETYANARSFDRFKQVITELTGFTEIIPTHQGRAAENILFGHLLNNHKDSWVVSNQSFDTTVGHILYNGAKPLDIVIKESTDPSLLMDFKGDIDIAKLKEILTNNENKVSVVTLVLTNNAGGGQPVSMDNVRDVSALCKKHNKLFFLDIARFLENCYFIQQRDKSCAHMSLQEIAHEVCSYADGVWMSAKKDAFVNIGGYIALKDSKLADSLRERLILFEGFPSYGGLAGRDLEAIATGLEEAVGTEAIAHRVSQVAYLVDSLNEIGVPVILPAGGHAAFVDAKQLLPHIPPEQFPAQALACDLYLRGAIRSVEIGSLMFGTHENGTFIPATMELVRLAIPRRTYEKAHFDYVISVFEQLIKDVSNIKGLEITEEPELLRHFTCKLKPISNSFSDVKEKQTIIH